jgi:hypothetical protein
MRKGTSRPTLFGSSAMEHRSSHYEQPGLIEQRSAHEALRLRKLADALGRQWSLERAKRFGIGSHIGDIHDGEPAIPAPLLNFLRHPGAFDDGADVDVRKCPSTLDAGPVAGGGSSQSCRS